MAFPQSAVERAQVELLHDAIRQLIGMVESWDMGKRIVWPQPLPPLDEYLAQAGALDAQGNRINSPRTHQLIDQHFELRRQHDAMLEVKPTGTDPNEVLPNFEQLCDVAGGLAATLGWPRPVTMTILNDFDRRKPLPSGSQHPLWHNLEVFPPPPGVGPVKLPFTHEIWMPWPRQDFPDFPGQFPPTPNPGPPIQNELVAHSWAMHNDQDKPQFLDLIRQWERLTREAMRALEEVEPGATAVASAAAKAEPADRTPAKPKRSTERDEAKAKLIAALTKHHQYADGGCLNLEPVGVNELARLAGVSQSSASRFFKSEFRGRSAYRACCRDASKLVIAMKMLNHELAPHQVFHRSTADVEQL